MAFPEPLCYIQGMGSLRGVIRDPAVLKRMEVTFDLCETAEVIMRQNLCRRHPGLDAAEIDRLLVEWRHRRPGAEHGDAVGRPIAKDRVTKWLVSRKS